MQRDVPTTNWCGLANAKCYILCLQALAISKARLCDAVEMHTRNLYRNSKSILERLFSIARLGSQTTMTSSIAPKHMSMHNRRRMGRSEGSIFSQTQPLILVSSERSFASCGNKQARSNPTTKMEKAMFFPDFSRCFNRTHSQNNTQHQIAQGPRAQRVEWPPPKHARDRTIDGQPFHRLSQAWPRGCLKTELNKPNLQHTHAHAHAPKCMMKCNHHRHLRKRWSATRLLSRLLHVILQFA